MTKSDETYESRALGALSKVEDPDLKKDLVTLGMIQDLSCSLDAISFKLVLTTPACPLKNLLRSRCEEVLKEEFGSEIQVHVTFDAQVTQAAGRSKVLKNIKNIVGVSSGKGGVGKSTISANLAVAWAEQGAKVGVVDADIFGPSLPTLFGCQNEKVHVFKKDNKNMLMPLEQYGVELMSLGFLVDPEQAVMWRGPMASTALKQLIGDTEWSALDYLLVDLPPGTSDIPITLSQSFPIAGMLTVSTSQEIALADVRKSIAMYRQPQIHIPLLGIVENMAYFVSETGVKHYLFGKEGVARLAEEQQLPLLGSIPIYEAIGNNGDKGYPAVLKQGPWREAFFELASRVAQQIAIQNATLAAHQQPIIDQQSA